MGNTDLNLDPSRHYGALPNPSRIRSLLSIYLWDTVWEHLAQRMLGIDKLCWNADL